MCVIIFFLLGRGEEGDADKQYYKEEELVLGAMFIDGNAANLYPICEKAISVQSGRHHIQHKKS